MVCPTCEGRKEGCDGCNGTGEFVIEGCPHAEGRIGRDGADAVFAADQAAMGNWPVAGGWMDQSASALEAVRMVWREENAWKQQQAEE